ncbi:MAG: hypothetical protein AAGB29_06240 [Planctomycetota bacterium]
MDAMPQPKGGEEPKPPARTLQRNLARAGVLGGLLVLVGLFVFNGVEVSVEAQGDSRKYTASSALDYIFYVFPVLTANLAVVFWLREGIYRVFGVVLGVLTLWLAFQAIDLGLADHHVTVTPTGFTRQVGSSLAPMRQAVDFEAVTTLYIEETPAEHGPEYTLVAFSSDVSEVRVPIYDLMRTALPDILDVASRYEILMLSSDDGQFMPSGLRELMLE